MKVILILLLALHFSCIEKRSTGKVTHKTALGVSIPKDTLQFTSGISAIFQDRKGNYWFGSTSEGVAFYDGKEFVYFTVKDGLADNQIRSIKEDKSGVIWFNTQEGISSYDGVRIKNHVYLASGNSPIQHNTSLTNWTKTDDALWFDAGISEGVYMLNGQELNYLAFPIGEVHNSYDSLFSVTSISKGKSGILWLGTYAGVLGYNGRDFTFITDETLGFVGKKEYLHVRSIYEDSKGRLWIGNNGIGVLVKEGNAITHFSKTQGKLIPMDVFARNTKTKQFEKNTGLQSVFAITEDAEGNIWFGDRDSGAWKYDGSSLTNYVVNVPLSSSMIWTIYKDSEDNLLFGMADGNVFRFNGKAFEKQF